jgi:hypothetical protein
MCYPEFLEALMELANEAGAGRQNQHPQVALNARSGDGGYLVSLAGARGCLHNDAGVASLQGLPHLGELPVLIVTEDSAAARE